MLSPIPEKGLMHKKAALTIIFAKIMVKSWDSIYLNTGYTLPSPTHINLQKWGSVINLFQVKYFFLSILFASILKIYFSFTVKMW
jgi:hypothetical protein